MLSLEQTKYELVRGRAESWIPNFANPDRPCLIFLDPPFSSDEYDLILEKLAILPAILKGSLIIVESPVTREIMFAENMELLKHRSYGSITLDILRKN
jgi:16S rRNA G966 N2-methylase RsmD